MLKAERLQQKLCRPPLHQTEIDSQTHTYTQRLIFRPGPRNMRGRKEKGGGKNAERWREGRGGKGEKDAWRSLQSAESDCPQYRAHTHRQTHALQSLLSDCLPVCLPDWLERDTRNASGWCDAAAGRQEPVNRGGRHAEDRAVPPIAASKQRGGEGGGSEVFTPSPSLSCYALLWLCPVHANDKSAVGSQLCCPSALLPQLVNSSSTRMKLMSVKKMRPKGYLRTQKNNLQLGQMELVINLW